MADLKAEAKGRGGRGCWICGEPTAGYFARHVKEPHESMAGLPRAERKVKSGKTIISRSTSYCERHLVEAWDHIEALLAEASRQGEF
jgi:hypothetical protein